MCNNERKYAHLSNINKDFEPLIPAVNIAFEKIWQYSDINEFRENWTRTRSSYPDFVPLEGLEVSHRTFPARDTTELEIRIWRPVATKGEKLPLLFVLHGGGFVVGGHDSENGMSRSVCVRSRMVVISVGYRRAPEHKFPIALEDSYDGYQWVLKNSEQLEINIDKVILGGTSAGANLIASLALKLRDEHSLAGVIGQVLNLPVTCHPRQFPHRQYELNSYIQNAESPTINGNHMRWFWDQYYPEGGAHPLACPLLAESHAGLPPTLIQIAGLDPLRDEGFAYADVLKAAGVKTEVEVFPGLPHGFVLAVKMPFASRFFENIVRWVDEQLP